MTRKAPIITIITNRNTGKTTKTFRLASENKSRSLYSPDIKTNKSSPDTSFWRLQRYYGGNITWNKKIDAFVDGDGNPVGFIGSLSGTQDIKNTAERYREVEYIVFDEFLPADRPISENQPNRL